MAFISLKRCVCAAFIRAAFIGEGHSFEEICYAEMFSDHFENGLIMHQDQFQKASKFKKISGGACSQTPLATTHFTQMPVAA